MCREAGRHTHLPSGQFEVHEVARVIHVEELIDVEESVDPRAVDVRRAHLGGLQGAAEAGGEHPRRVEQHHFADR